MPRVTSHDDRYQLEAHETTAPMESSSDPREVLPDMNAATYSVEPGSGAELVPIEESMYGKGKPVRVVIRARVISG